MRKRFIHQPDIGVIAISEVTIPSNSRDELPPVLRALQKIFVTPSYHDRIFKILEDSVLKGKQSTGRNGMDLWEILVLSVIRLTLDTNYDRLEHISNYDSLVRQIMGVEKSNFRKGKTYSLTSLKENIGLLDAETLLQINAIVLEAGKEHIKKKTIRKLTSRQTHTY